MKFKYTKVYLQYIVLISKNEKHLYNYFLELVIQLVIIAIFKIKKNLIVLQKGVRNYLKSSCFRMQWEFFLL